MAQESGGQKSGGGKPAGQGGSGGVEPGRQGGEQGAGLPSKNHGKKSGGGRDNVEPKNG